MFFCTPRRIQAWGIVPVFLLPVVNIFSLTAELDWAKHPDLEIIPKYLSQTLCCLVSNKSL